MGPVPGRVDLPVTLAIEDRWHHRYGNLTFHLALGGIDSRPARLRRVRPPGNDRAEDKRQDQAEVGPTGPQNSRMHRQESQVSEKPQAPGSAQQQERGTSGFEHSQ